MNLKPASVTFMLPEDLVQAIDSLALATGKDRTTVVVQALRQAFGLQDDRLFLTAAAIDEANAEIEYQNKISTLETRMGELERKVDILNEQIEELSQPKLIDENSFQNITAISKHLLHLITQPAVNVQQVKDIIPQISNFQSASDVLPSQYLQLDNFLSQAEWNRLLDYVIRHESNFLPTSTSANDADYRRSLVLHSFPEFSQLITERLQTILPPILSQFEISPFTISTIEAQLTAHNDGNYYRIHNDNGSPETATREFTYVYYFYREPKPFSGGELRIYDSKIENNFYVAAESFKTVEPRNNSIVFFPSRYLHEVLPVSCPSKTFANSRFTINGWIRR